MKDDHHSPPGEVFTCEGSPLKGRVMPPDWRRLSCFRTKAQALMAAGLAATWEEACSLMGRHAAAVKAARKRRATERNRPGGSAGGKWWDR